MFRLLLALLLSLVAFSAFAQTGPTPSYTSLTTGGINHVIYITPYSAQNPTGVKTDCSADAMSSINAIIQTASTTPPYTAEIILPPGCLGATVALTVPGSASWNYNTNPSIYIHGAGRNATTIKALTSLTNLYYKDGNYSQRGGLYSLTLDGQNIVTNVFNHQFGSDFYYDDLLIENAAPGGIALKHGTSGTSGQESFYSHIEIRGLNPDQFTNPANLPAYAFWGNITDSHFEDILAWNATTAIIYENPNSAGNRWVNTHAFGYGPGSSILPWFPQYCYQITGLGSHYSNGGCDGATVAAVSVSGYQNTVSGFNAGWAANFDSSPTVGSANAYRLESGSSNNVIAGNTFTQVSNNQACYVPGGGTNYNIMQQNAGCTYGVGSLLGDSLNFSGSYGQVNTPNGIAFSTFAPSSAVNYFSINSGSGSNAPQFSVASPGSGDVIGMNLISKNGGAIQANGQTISRFVAYPATSSTACTPGDWSAIASYIAVCYATNSWVRSAAATW